MGEALPPPKVRWYAVRSERCLNSWDLRISRRRRESEGKVLPYSNSLVDLLAKQLEECCNDGIDCEHCPVAAECTACWDTISQQLVLDEYQYSGFAARLAELRNRKRSLADGGQAAVSNGGELDAGKAV
jgi:hypothetical protein